MTEPRIVADLARRLDQVRDELRHLRQVESDLQTAITEVVTDQTRIFPDPQIGGEWRIEIQGGKDYTGWDSEAVLGRLAAVTSVDADGVKLPAADARQAFIEAIRACAPLTASLGWRRDALRAYGLDPEDYATTKAGATSVQVIYQAPPAGSAEHDQW